MFNTNVRGVTNTPSDPPDGVPVNSPEAQSIASEFFKKVAPPPMKVENAWDVAKKSPVHRLPILCNGEASAERDEQGLPKDGTGNKCKYYWAFRRIPNMSNAEQIEKGEVTRVCRNWESAEGPMEFDEGRILMANLCDCFEPSSPARPYVAALEQAPPSKKEIAEAEAEKEAEQPPPAAFDPGLALAADYVHPTVYGQLPAQLTIEKDAGLRRWIIHNGDRDYPIVNVPFRLAYDAHRDEIARDQRFPKSDVRRYDKDRLFALELCLERSPLAAEDWPSNGEVPWTPVLNKPRPAATIEDALKDL